MSKTQRRKPLNRRPRGKAIDKSCRNHGTCPACLSNRTIAQVRQPASFLEEWSNIIKHRNPRRKQS